MLLQRNVITYTGASESLMKSPITPPQIWHSDKQVVNNSTYEAFEGKAEWGWNVEYRANTGLKEIATSEVNSVRTCTGSWSQFDGR